MMSLPAIAWHVSQATLAAENNQSPVPIGYIVLAVILAPVISFALAAVFTHPRQYRVPGLFIASVILLIGAMVAGFAIISVVLKLIVPQ